ncbi:exodeoxyribonuclease DIN7 NDAI_0H00860 [Naumovozyma dairenensis CBS 421]|uniref:Uncharacterized protein n=1 Tax=Naumovozyma dairenensis (strain ATCC 10597 / BCRC 20456 / CBS 421 / NBRC 0211 / NRRL Y-12639) TaxID=1071378 RepID=G0WEP9_NAUDC|nr:hypothetical protein NDAI_0H00860 [Naumovozyma dairenensis CBS 421]CCD26260.1 hypothetical protein NDAI_0H00860 [Naumovozyma dairenensis CBS 421]
MGIAGLLPQLKTIQRPMTLSRYAGMTLGIDGYAWLHKAACSCAYELVMGRPTEKYLQYFIRKFKMMKQLNIQPFVVFDGGPIEVKRAIEMDRLRKRENNKLMAKKLWCNGERHAAMERFQKSVDVTTEMAKCIIDYCKDNSIPYVIAPFEADSQMVYLEKIGMIDGIISEDSDILIFGGNRLITKLNDSGDCLQISSADFIKVQTEKFPIGELTADQIRMLVCLSGCDYTNGIWKIGLITAMKLVKQFSDMNSIISYLKELNNDKKKYIISDTFLQEYEFANYSFQYQRVFCPKRNEIVTLNEISNITSNKELEIISQCIGSVVRKGDKSLRKECVTNSEDINHELYLQVAVGNLDPQNFMKRLISREIKLKEKYGKERERKRNTKKATTNIFIGENHNNLLNTIPSAFNVGCPAY